MSKSGPSAKAISDILNMPAPKFQVYLPLSSELQRFYSKDESRSKSGSSKRSDQAPRDAICSFFKKGQCNKGRDCRFIHQNSNVATKYKTEMCKNFQQGTCPFKDKCSFAHGKNELRADQKH